MKAKPHIGRSQAQKPNPVPLSDDEWSHIDKRLSPDARKGGRPNKNRRQHIEGMRWVAWTGKPWVDMPEEFGNANTVRRYFARLRHNGVFDTLLTVFPKTSQDKSLETVRTQLECLGKLKGRRPRGSAALHQAV